jgi:hypothetical protein
MEGIGMTPQDLIEREIRSRCGKLEIPEEIICERVNFAVDCYRKNKFGVRASDIVFDQVNEAKREAGRKGSS